MQVLTARHETVELVTSLLRGSGAELASALEIDPISVSQYVARDIA